MPRGDHRKLSLQEQLAEAQARAERAEKENKRLEQNNAELQAKIKKSSAVDPISRPDGVAFRSAAKGGFKLIDAMGLRANKTRYNRLQYIANQRIHAYLLARGRISEYTNSELEAAIAAVANEVAFFRHFKGYWPVRDFWTQNLDNVTYHLHKALEEEAEAEAEDVQEGGWKFEGVRRLAPPPTNPVRAEKLQKKLEDKRQKVTERIKKRAINAAAKANTAVAMAQMHDDNTDDLAPFQMRATARRRAIITSDLEDEQSVRETSSHPSTPSNLASETRFEGGSEGGSDDGPDDGADSGSGSDSETQVAGHLYRRPSPPRPSSPARQLHIENTAMSPANTNHSFYLHPAEWTQRDDDETHEVAALSEIDPSVGEDTPLPTHCPKRGCRDALPVDEVVWLQVLFERRAKAISSDGKDSASRRELDSQICDEIKSVLWQAARHAEIRDEASEKGWDREIDWDGLPRRVGALKSCIKNVLTDAEVLEGMDGWDHFLKCVDYDVWEFVEAYSANVGIVELSKRFPEIDEAGLCGYYGPKGANIIQRTLDHILVKYNDDIMTEHVRKIEHKPHSWGINPERPCFPKAVFINYVLIHTVAAQLIGQDLKIADGGGAFKVLIDSSNYGRLVNPAPKPARTSSSEACRVAATPPFPVSSTVQMLSAVQKAAVNSHKKVPTQQGQERLGTHVLSLGIRLWLMRKQTVQVDQQSLPPLTTLDINKPNTKGKRKRNDEPVKGSNKSPTVQVDQQSLLPLTTLDFNKPNTKGKRKRNDEPAKGSDKTQDMEKTSEKPQKRKRVTEEDKIKKNLAAPPVPTSPRYSTRLVTKMQKK